MNLDPGQHQTLVNTQTCGKTLHMCSETISEKIQMVKVPLSLKILFRKISIQVPNIEKLVCGLMRTAGLKLPQSMAKNLLQSCNLVFKLLKVFPGCKLHLYKLLIGQVTQKLNVMPDVPENQVFYSVLSQYFKHCLTTEDFLIAKHIFNTTFKIEKNVEDKMAMSFERDYDKSRSLD